jgi:hypothetical protein
MAIEPRRGCGYRKIGGLYMCAPSPNLSCCRFPFKLHICPTCNQGIKQSRAPQWFNPAPFMLEQCQFYQPMCPHRHGWLAGERALLIWIGEKYYGSPDHFLDEAKRMGISRRIKSIPRGFVLGETKVFFAHPHCTFTTADGGVEYGPGCFGMVIPTRFELIVTDKPTPKQKKRLEDERIFPVEVPANDPDHNYHTVEDPDFEEIWNGNQQQAGSQRSSEMDAVD